MSSVDVDESGEVTVQTDDGLVDRYGVADIAEVAKGRLRVALEDGTTGMTGGSLFGAWGRWKIWVECPDGSIQTYLGQRPLTMPNDTLSIVDESRGAARKVRVTGRIKRLKRADL